MACWMACSFGFYMLAYVLKYLEGSIFFNAYASSAAEIIGKLSTIFVLQCASLKRGLLISFGTGLLGIFLLIFFSDSESWIPLMFFIAKFGLSQAFVIVYLSVIFLYPTILSQTAMGACNLLARIATIMAPLIAEVRSPINLIVLFIICGAGLIASQCMIMPKNGSQSTLKSED